MPMVRILSKKNDSYYHFLSRIRQIEQTSLAKRFLYDRLHGVIIFVEGEVKVRSKFEKELKKEMGRL